MNKLMLVLVLMIHALLSGVFASDFTGDVSVSEPRQLIVDVGSDASTMLTVAKKSMLVKNTLQNAKSDTVSIGTQYAEGTGGYISGSRYWSRATLFSNGLKRLTG